MYSERIQLLISKEQRRRLEQEAKRRGTSVASVVRDAVDAQLGAPTRQQRLEALERIRSRHGAPFLTPEELNDLVAEEREANIPEEFRT
jgi:ribosome maturation protein Sdo1